MKTYDIYNCKELFEIEQEINKLEPDTTKQDFEYDVYFVFKIHKKSGEVSTIAIEGFYSDKLTYNGVSQKINLRLIYLLKKYSRYYSRAREVRRYGGSIPELKDSINYNDYILHFPASRNIQ